MIVPNHYYVKRCIVFLVSICNIYSKELENVYPGRRHMDKKAGKCSCGCKCAGCAMADKCHSKK